MTSDQSLPEGVVGRGPDPFAAPPAGWQPPPAWPPPPLSNPQPPQSLPHHPWTGPPPTAGRPPRHTSRVLAIAIILAFVGGLLVGGAAVGVVWAARSLSGGQSDGSAAAALDAALPGLMEFVEQERGLAFLGDVDVAVLDDEEFESMLLAPAPNWGRARPDDYGATFTALGMTPDADTYYAAEAAVNLDYLVGFFDPAVDQMIVRGTEWTPLVEITVVHELVHALQDQHFDLGARFEGTDEASLAARAIAEGDAVRIEDAYFEAQDREWQQRYENESWYPESDTPFDPMADYVGWLPYWLGSTAVATLVELGGNAAVDDALRDPPTTSEQLVEIGAWRAGDDSATHAVEVESPGAPSDAEIIDEGTLGVALLSVLPMDFADEFYPTEFVTGWRGDRYVSWRDGDEVCTSVTALLDSDPDVTAATTALADWAVRTGAQVAPLDGPDAPGLSVLACAG